MDSYCVNCEKPLSVPMFLENLKGICPFCKGETVFTNVMVNDVFIEEEEDKKGDDSIGLADLEF